MSSIKSRSENSQICTHLKGHTGHYIIMCILNVIYYRSLHTYCQSPITLKIFLLLRFSDIPTEFILGATIQKRTPVVGYHKGLNFGKCNKVQIRNLCYRAFILCSNEKIRPKYIFFLYENLI